MNLRYSLHALALLAVAAGATLVAAPASADTGWHIVGNGETLTWPHAYTYYRFIVKARSAETDRLAFSELALYDADGTRLTAGLAEADSEARATTNLVAASFAYYGRLDIYSGRNSIFDGSTTTFIDGWIDRWDDSKTADDQKWKWEYIVIRLANGANPVASYNVAYSSENGKPIRGWALEGSDDHTTWFTLDERDIPAVAAIAPSGTGWCNGGAAIPVTKDSARFFVERGGTLAVTAPADAKSVHAYGGTVSIASQATLGIDVDAGESDRCVGGGLAGTGTFEKTGAGTLVVSGVNDAFAGTVKSSGGTLAFRPLHASPKYTYYRFIVKDRDAVYGGDDHFKLTEIALFDADGRHINGGLVEAAAEDKTTTNLLAGTFAVYRKQESSWGNDSYKNVFDGKTSTGCHVWISRYNSEWHWAYFVFRPMAGNDVAPAFYNIGFAADCNVRSWALQGSDDHTTWITLDEMNAAAVAAIKPEGAGWGNGGTPLTLLSEGDNAPMGEVDAKFIRYTIRAVGNGDTQGTRSICELALYDLFGKRLNAGLSDMGRNYSGTLPAGSFTYYSQWAPEFNGNASNFGPQKLFDDDLSTRMHGWNFGNFPDPATPATRISFTMRLPDDATPVASYNFAPFSGVKTSSSVPNDWLVEASRDGTTWFTVDERSGEAAAALLPSTGSTYCNNGHPIGFTAGLDRWLCPTGAAVEVANGATLELPAASPNAVSGLVADLTATGNAGTIVNFNPAVGGTLYMTCASRRQMLDNHPLPITFANPVNTGNVAGWSVVVNGTPAEANEYALRFDENNVFRVTRRRAATVILIQ